MNKIKIISVGKQDDAAAKSIIDQYESRMKRWVSIEWQFLPHASGDSVSAQQIAESKSIANQLRPNDYVILLDETGVQVTNQKLAGIVEQALNQAANQVVFIIGGAYGVDDALRTRADFVLSLSPLVFPHKLVRVLLTEQLYRTFSILHGLPYHH